jgi:t-SNARE complex subunit (syntaxin)
MDRFNDIKKLISLNDLAINRAKENLEIYQENREEHLHYKSLLEIDRMAINSISERLRLYKVQGKILQRELSKLKIHI